MGNNYLKTRLSQPEVIQRITVDLKYGGNSKVYFNIKNVLGDPEIRNKLSDQLYKLFPENITCVYGEGFGGRPLAEAISSRHYLKYTTLRKEKKDMVQKPNGNIINQLKKIGLQLLMMFSAQAGV